VRIWKYVYPLREPKTGALTTAESYDPGESLRGLYQYVLGRGLVQPLTNYTPEHLPIFSRDVLTKIGRGAGWEQLVPVEVETLIRERRAFGFRPERGKSAA
jgi:hypothetical protein